MILVVDVHYEPDGSALCAGLGVEVWTDPAARTAWTCAVTEVAAYEPGQFARRELPCLLQLLQMVDVDLDVIVVDGNAWNSPGAPGLGARLYRALGGAVPVVGVAKSRFAGVVAEEVLRGRSRKPLYVTSVGVDAGLAADWVRKMAGPFRLPSLLQQVDHLARGRLLVDEVLS